VKSSLIGKKSKAFAPATTGNVAVGFDLLGFAMDIAGDTVSVEIISEPRVIIDSQDSKLPRDPKLNTAGLGLIHLIEDFKLDFGFKVHIEKGIATGSGMGGSAASSAAAITAVNALLPKPLLQKQLLAYALIGESIASGSFHADNIAPCLWGGLTSAHVINRAQNLHSETRAKDLTIDVLQIPVPPSIYVALIHPHLIVETKSARGVLKPNISLKDHVKQSSCLIQFISGCYTNNMDWIGQSLVDHLIEPQRAHLIPGFFEAKSIALQKGALGFSISGAGPSVFAWAPNKKIAEEICESVSAIFMFHQLKCDTWVTPISNRGARCIT
jgi:homoserine kinase